MLDEHPEYIGTKANGEFLILARFIDAKKDLSVQVHPDDEYALEYEGQNGKTEMWYIIGADDGASLIYGFKHKVSKEILERAIEKGELGKHLQKVEFHKGDLFSFLPVQFMALVKEYFLPRCRRARMLLIESTISTE